MNARAEDLELLALMEEDDKRRAQRNFLSYYMRMTGFEPPAHVKLMCRLVQAMEDDKIDRAMVFLPPRAAKRLADDTPMLTANRGWTTHGELRVGDKVWHPSGNPVDVLAVSKPGKSDLLVTFSDGQQIQCDADHLWTVYDTQFRQRDQYRGYKTWETLTTKEILDRGILVDGKKGNRGSRFRWQIPEMKGIDGQHVSGRMDPYTLGAWLGDGSSIAARFTLDPQDKNAITNGLIDGGYAPSKVYIHATTGVPTVSFGNGKGNGKSDLRKDLEREGVWGDKHIPDAWFNASRTQRQKLLAGLIDTDGYCDKHGRLSISSTIERLATDIVKLCATLGYRPLRHKAPPRNGNGSKIVSKSDLHIVHFSPFEDVQCRVVRKRQKKHPLRRAISIRSIERVAAKSCRCIKVNADDGLYLAGESLIPTHNTTVCSHLAPSWIIGRHPDTAIMSVCHTEKYADKIGGNVRKYLRSPQWPFDDVRLSDDTFAKAKFTTNHGGEYNGFGMFGGNQHGNPAEWLFMDDIMKGRKIALSSHMRDEAWETYKADLDSRMQGRNKKLLTFTRWHQDDVAGRMLPEDYDGKTGWVIDRETGERWYVLSIPAVAERDDDPLGRAVGQWIWPGRIDENYRGGTRRRGGWIWSALYQQRPSPEEGLMFTQEHIERYNPDTLDRASLQVYGSSDYAVTAEAGSPDPDYTVHMIWGVDSEFNIYLLDMWRARTESDKWVANMIRMAKRHKPLRWGEEAGQIIKSVGPFLSLMLEQEKVYIDRVQLNSSLNKEQRAQSLLGMAAMGKMYLPDRTKIPEYLLQHVDAFERELLEFPTGKHEDTVDAASLFARMLNRILAGRRPKSPLSPHGATLSDLFSEHEADLDRKASDW